MSSETASDVGSVVALWRYPVKSMMGEELNAVAITPRGLLGDRAYALIDPATGKVASAKNPKKWPSLFDFRAAFVNPPGQGSAPPPVQVTLPDGTLLAGTGSELDYAISKALGREAVLRSTPPEKPTLEEYWPDMENLDHRDTVTDEAIPPGSFFDGAAVHLLTTGTIDRLRGSCPEARFEIRRFRPNIVVRPNPDEARFAENDWIGRTVAIGDEVQLSVSGPCPRCVMTTLAQGDLPRDTAVLKTAVKENQGHVGVYASVTRGGIIRRGDSIRLIV